MNFCMTTTLAPLRTQVQNWSAMGASHFRLTCWQTSPRCLGGLGRLPKSQSRLMYSALSSMSLRNSTPDLPTSTALLYCSSRDCRSRTVFQQSSETVLLQVQFMIAQQFRLAGSTTLVIFCRFDWITLQGWLFSARLRLQAWSRLCRQSELFLVKLPQGSMKVLLKQSSQVARVVDWRPSWRVTKRLSIWGTQQRWMKFFMLALTALHSISQLEFCAAARVHSKIISITDAVVLIEELLDELDLEGGLLRGLVPLLDVRHPLFRPPVPLHIRTTAIEFIGSEIADDNQGKRQQQEQHQLEHPLEFDLGRPVPVDTVVHLDCEVGDRGEHAVPCDHSALLQVAAVGRGDVARQHRGVALQAHSLRHGSVRDALLVGRLVVLFLKVDGDETLRGDSVFADGTGEEKLARVEPAVDAPPAVEVSAASDDRLLGLLETDVALVPAQQNIIRHFNNGGSPPQCRVSKRPATGSWPRPQ